MNSPSDQTRRPEDILRYAPKWARISNSVGPQTVRKIYDCDLPGQDDVSSRANSNLSEETRSVAREDRENPADSMPTLFRSTNEELRGDQFRIPRSLNPDMMPDPWRTPSIYESWSIAALWQFALAAIIAALVAFFMVWILPTSWTVTSRGQETHIPEPRVVDLRSNLFEPTVSVGRVQPTTVAASDAQVVPAMSATTRGITDNEIRFGIAAPFTGPARKLGEEMRLGIETAFKLANDGGGVHGRHLSLVTADDGYEPARTADAMKQLYDGDQVFGIIGNVGTPTAMVSVPYALDHQMLFFGAFTGASMLRRDPPDRYVFNYRASYAEETAAAVHYLVKVRRLRPDQIAVFAQQDAYGDAGFAGVAKALRALGGDVGATLRLNYQRNTANVVDAVAQLRKQHTLIKAVVMVATYQAAAKFIERTRDLYPSMIYTNVSFVGSTALAEELMRLGPRYATGVIVTQVVPAVDSYSTIVLGYKAALGRYFPGEDPDYVSLEGYVDASILAEALKRTEWDLDTEKLVQRLENLHSFDMGLGTLISFGQTEHQGSHKVWGTQLDAEGHYQPIDLQ